MSDLTPAASAGALLGWRSIDSAPRDGTLFLGCNLDHPSFGSWPMYRRVRHSVDAAGEMVTTDLGGWAMVRDLQPDWGELEPVGPEPQVSNAPDNLNGSVRYGWMPRPAPGSPAEKGEDEDEARRDAWSDFESDHLTDGKGHATADVYRTCRTAFDAAWPHGRDGAIAAAIAILSAPGSPAEKGEGEPVRETIFNALRRYKLTNMVEAEDSGIGYPLIDLMSNDGTTIETGEAEMRVLADHISEALEKAATHPSSDQSDTERMRVLREGWAAEMFDAGHTVSQRSWTDADVTEEQRDNYRRAVDRQVEKGLAALAERAADQSAAASPKTRYFPADFAPAYLTVAAGGLALPADPLPRIITLPGRHADPDAFAVNLSATIGDDAEACGICDVVFITGDRCLTDISLGAVHAACCGPERESYVDLETGDALAADAPIPTPWIWIRNADGTISLAEVAA